MDLINGFDQVSPGFGSDPPTGSCQARGSLQVVLTVTCPGRLLCALSRALAFMRPALSWAIELLVVANSIAIENSITTEILFFLAKLCHDIMSRPRSHLPHVDHVVTQRTVSPHRARRLCRDLEVHVATQNALPGQLLSRHYTHCRDRDYKMGNGPF